MGPRVAVTFSGVGLVVVGSGMLMAGGMFFVDGGGTYSSNERLLLAGSVTVLAGVTTSILGLVLLAIQNGRRRPWNLRILELRRELRTLEQRSIGVTWR